MKPVGSKSIILVLTSLIGQHDFGGTTHQAELIDQLSRDFDVRLSNMSPGKRRGRDSLPTMRIKELRAIYAADHVLQNIVQGLRITRKSEVRLIYVRHGISTLSATVLKKITGIPLVLEVNGIMSDEMMSRPGVTGRLLNFLDATGCRNSTVIVAVTHGLKEHFSEILGKDPNDIVVIPNGANTRIFRSMDRALCRKELRMPPSAKCVFFVGNVAPWQGLETLVDAAPSILRDVPGTLFIIAGTGERLQSLVDRANERGVLHKFTFVGNVPNAEVPRYISASDVCVAPFTKRRNAAIGLSPIKIYEYAACARPIVASRIRNLEFLEEMKAGLLFEPENAEQMASAVVSLLRDPARCERMGANGRAVVEAKYSWEITSVKLAEVFRRVIEHHNLIA